MWGGEAGETAEKSRHSSVNWVGAGVLWPGEVPGGNSVTVGYRFPRGPPLGEGYATYILWWKVKKHGKYRGC